LKKGCFLKFIIIFTVVLAAVLYLIQNKYDELILNPGKELAFSVMEKNWDRDLNYVTNSPEKDSLRYLLKYYIYNSKSVEKLVDKNTEDIIDYIEQTFKDSTVNKEELTYISKLINNALHNEE